MEQIFETGVVADKTVYLISSAHSAREFRDIAEKNVTVRRTKRFKLDNFINNVSTQFVRKTMGLKGKHLAMKILVKSDGGKFRDLKGHFVNVQVENMNTEQTAEQPVA